MSYNAPQDARQDLGLPEGPEPCQDRGRDEQEEELREEALGPGLLGHITARALAGS